jgi:hypothetical protein
MLDPSRPAFIWLIWPYLSWSERLSVLVLCALGVYWLLLAVILVRFQNVAAHLSCTASTQKGLRIRKRVRNLQQATVAAFYLFGFVLFACFQSAYFIIEDGNTPDSLIVVKNFQIHFAFAANAFLIFLVIQFIQWFVANRVSAVELQLRS